MTVLQIVSLGLLIIFKECRLTEMKNNRRANQTKEIMTYIIRIKKLHILKQVE
jgi:hypothetical protein